MGSEPRKQVVVAEDNFALAHVVKFNLERVGFTVHSAENGRVAWELMQSVDVDLLISDQQMPEMSGVELCKRVRADERYANLPIILLTAKRMELDLDELRDQLGISQAFAKPFSPAAVVQAATDLLAPIA